LTGPSVTVEEDAVASQTHADVQT